MSETSRRLLLEELDDDLRQPGLVGIADDDVDARKRGDGVGIGLRPAPGDDHACGGMAADRATNHLAVGEIRAARDRAGVDDHDVGALVEGDRAKSTLLEACRQLLRIDLVEPAAERDERDGAHALTSS